MLHSQVKGFEFFKPIEGKIGKLVGMIIDTDKWRVTHFVISRGMGKSAKMLINEKFIKQFDIPNNQILVTDEHEEEEVPTTSKREKFMCKDFIGITVMSVDGKKIGKVTDFDIPEKLKIWKLQFFILILDHFQKIRKAIICKQKMNTTLSLFKLKLKQWRTLQTKIT